MLAAHSADCHEVHAKVIPTACAPPTSTPPTLPRRRHGHAHPLRQALAGKARPLLLARHGLLQGVRRLRLVGAPALRHRRRLPLILLIFLHLRRFRPGGHLDAALITASCVAIVGFARGASTDMQLAAPFCIGMLGWYAWYETGKKFWLFDLYFFGAAATLAKGPVAPFLALAIILLFVGLRREWSALRRTIWIPGILLYLRWCCPGTSRCSAAIRRSSAMFFLEHNLERFATNRYQHHQPFWYYLAVLDPRPDALDGDLRSARWSTPSRSPSPSGRSATIPSATRPLRAPATPSPSSWCSGRSFPSCSSRSPARSCPATSCRRSRR